MKTYKRYITLLYCYDSKERTITQVSEISFDLYVYNYKFSDWNRKGKYQKATKEEFVAALKKIAERIEEIIN